MPPRPPAHFPQGWELNTRLLEYWYPPLYMDGMCVRMYRRTSYVHTYVHRYKACMRARLCVCVAEMWTRVKMIIAKFPHAPNSQPQRTLVRT